MKRMIITLILLSVTALPALAVPTNTSGPWGIDAGGFKNLSSALASPSTAGKTVVVSKPMAINNKTTDRAISVTAGGRINVASGKTVILGGSFHAGPYHVFAGSGNVTGLSEVYPEWWGAVSTASQTVAAANVIAINKAIDSIYNSSLITSRAGSVVLGGSYYVDPGIIMKSYVHLTVPHPTFTAMLPGDGSGTGWTLISQ